MSARILANLLIVGITTAASYAATLKGTVTNGTTGKPSAGDEVVLIKLASGMDEIGHVKTDAEGKFSFTFDDDNTPHLVRAVHQGVTYHKPAPPGTQSVEIQVYNAAPKVEGVNAVADLMSVQAHDGKLGITRVFAVDNNSNPPRTQMSDASFEFFVPDGAEIEAADAQTAGGQPVTAATVPQAQKGRYAFSFPLRPGQTQFRVTYHLPYSGKATIDPRPLYPLQHFVAILPRSIAFTAVKSGVYESRQPPDQTDAVAQLASNVQPSSKLAFEISGEGELQMPSEQTSAARPVASGPGGGLGAPIDAPDPLDKYRAYILAAFGAVLAAGAVYAVNRSRNRPVAAAVLGGHADRLLAALKEELFELEMEHKRGQISDQDYAKHKAALDQTLTRAARRKQ